SASRQNSSGKIFIATSRLSFKSRARYTSPIPPLPSRPVISCEPSCVPMVRAMNMNPKNTEGEVLATLRGYLRVTDYNQQNRFRMKGGFASAQTFQLFV